MKLSAKETELLSDLKSEEKLCIEKYTKHASCAKDPALKNLFLTTAEGEKTHLQWLDAIGRGEVPVTPASNTPSPSFKAVYTAANSPDKENDCYLCTDLLAGEKRTSSVYDTVIFEFRDEGMRKVLNTIQSQEQNHGKQLYDYMKTNFMYG